MGNIKLLQRRLNKIEKELSTCRTSVMQDGWQTSRHARKARKWDMLAEDKRNLLAKIEIEHGAMNDIPLY
jgi:allantoicase